MGASSTCAKAQKPSVLSETTRVTVNPDGHFCILPFILLPLDYHYHTVDLCLNRMVHTGK